MISRLAPLHAVLSLNTKLFLNALEGVTDELATTRPNERTNHMAFLACHVLDARCYLARYVGLEAETPFKEVLDGAKTIDDITAFPRLEAIETAWVEVSDLLGDGFSILKEPELQTPSPQSFPIGDKSTIGGIAFLLEHESYHIGQIALLRRFFGLTPMAYT